MQGNNQNKREKDPMAMRSNEEQFTITITLHDVSDHTTWVCLHFSGLNGGTAKSAISAWPSPLATRLTASAACPSSTRGAEGKANQQQI